MRSHCHEIKIEDQGERDALSLPPIEVKIKIMSKLNSEQYARLRREAKTPYRGLRIFIYIALGGSGFIGAVVFFVRLIAGNGELDSNLGNFALQMGVLALMIWLYRIDRHKSPK